MKRKMKTDTVRNREVQQFWKLCKGLGKQKEFVMPREVLTDYRRMALDNGTSRAMRAPTLEDIDRRGEGHRRSLRQTLPLAEARQY